VAGIEQNRIFRQLFDGEASGRTMKAICLEKPGQFVAVEVPDPGMPGAGEVLVKTHRMGICGTDISCYLGKFPFFAYPRIPGHELGC
jgi:threonine dehydrogenase-like Zn-dependent dehydrogenase